MLLPLLLICLMNVLTEEVRGLFERLMYADDVVVIDRVRNDVIRLFRAMHFVS